MLPYKNKILWLIIIIPRKDSLGETGSTYTTLRIGYEQRQDLLNELET